MATITPPQVHTDEEFEKEHRRNRGLIITVVILAIVAIGLGAALFYQIATTEAMPSEVEQVLDDYIGSWETGDPDAFLASVGEDFILTEYIYSETGASADALTFAERIYRDDRALLVNLAMGSANYTPYDAVERGDAVVVMGDGPWIVSFEETWIHDSNTLSGMAIYLVELVDGVPQITNHAWVGYSEMIEF